MTTVSAVIPVYRSKAMLPELLRQLVTVLDKETVEFEVIFVDDFSNDGTWYVIEQLASQDNRVRGLQLSRNFGQHNALLCGIRAARYDVVLTLDDDLQNPPDEIPHLLAKLAEGYDVVYGAPSQLHHGFLRNQASRVTKIVLQGTMGATTARRVSAFRAFRANLRMAFENFRCPYVSIDVLLTWGTTRFTHVTVRHDPRRIGDSNYTVRRLIAHGLNMMTGFTTIPLQLASLAGFCFAIVGLCVLGYVLITYVVRGGSVPGFSFLASAIAIFSGVQLAALGIIGEYLARMHLRTMDRPPYMVLAAAGVCARQDVARRLERRSAIAENEADDIARRS